MNTFLDSYKLAPNVPVLAFNIPRQIQKELDVWVNESKKFKNSPLAELKAHENVGYLAMDGKPHNSYQCSISPHLIESSFWLAWTLRIAAKYWGGGKSHRDFKLRKWDGHHPDDIRTNHHGREDDKMKLRWRRFALTHDLPTKISSRICRIVRPFLTN